MRRESVCQTSKAHKTHKGSILYSKLSLIPHIGRVWAGGYGKPHTIRPLLMLFLLIFMLLTNADQCNGSSCAGTPQVFYDQDLDGYVHVDPTQGIVRIDLQVYGLGSRPSYFSWCEVDANMDNYPDVSTESPNSFSSMSPSKAPANSPSASPVQAKCPSKDENKVQCGLDEISVYECWALSCCFDPTSSPRCYSLDGQRLLQSALTEEYSDDLSTDDYDYHSSASTDYYYYSSALSQATDLPLCSEAPKNASAYNFSFGIYQPKTRVRVKVSLHDGCEIFDPVNKTFTFDATSTFQCPAYDDEPPGSLNSCYCADSSMIEDSCPTCVVLANTCDSDNYVVDAVSGRCILDSPICRYYEGATVDPNSAELKDPVELYPIYPNKCTTPTRTPTNFPTGNPTLAPVVQVCEIYEGNPGKVTTNAACALPFTYLGDDIATEVVFEYPPLIEEAKPYNVTEITSNVDPDKLATLRWCPVNGTLETDTDPPLYSLESGDSSSLAQWGFVQCLDPASLPTLQPTMLPTKSPSPWPSKNPTVSPTQRPTKSPTYKPTSDPTMAPTEAPTESPTQYPSLAPTLYPTENPTQDPTKNPTQTPTLYPSFAPTDSPTRSPTQHPSLSPTDSPSKGPTKSPTPDPTKNPTMYPTSEPTQTPTNFPTQVPTLFPTLYPTNHPTQSPTLAPTQFPTRFPTQTPTVAPTYYPTLWHGCVITDGNVGYVKNHHDCQIPFTFKRGKTTINFNYAPQFQEAQPYGVSYSRFDTLDPTLRWCPKLGVTFYSVFNTDLRKRWGLANCTGVVPTAAPTEISLESAESNEPADCVNLCGVGYTFNSTRGKCVPLIAPTCAAQYYYDSATCSVRRCGSVNGQQFELSLEPYLDISSSVIRLKVKSNVLLRDLAMIDVTWTDVGAVASLIPVNGSVRDGEFLYSTGLAKLEPGSELRYAFNASDNCNRTLENQIGTIEVPNDPPVILLNSTIQIADVVGREPLTETNSGVTTNITVKRPKGYQPSDLLAFIDSTQSYDPEGNSLSYIWRATQDLNVSLSSLNEDTLEFSFITDGTFSIDLEVLDANGGIAIRNLSITLLPNISPKADLTNTKTDLPFGVFSTIILNGTKSSDDQIITSVNWQYRGYAPIDENEEASFVSTLSESSDEETAFEHLLENLRNYQVPGYISASNTSLVNPNIVSPNDLSTEVTNVVYPGSYNFSLQVADNESLNASASILLLVNGFSSTTLSSIKDSIELTLPNNKHLLYAGSYASISWSTSLLARSSHLFAILELQAEGSNQTMLLKEVSASNGTTEIYLPSGLRTGNYYAALRLRYQFNSTTSVALPYTSSSDVFTIRKRYSYASGGWSACEIASNCTANEVMEGIQRRSLSCVDLLSDGDEVSSEFCLASPHYASPATTRRCRAICHSPNIVLGINGWTSCEYASCNANTASSRSRSLQCYDISTGQTLALTQATCAKLEKSPVLITTTESCVEEDSERPWWCLSDAQIFKKYNLSEFSSIQECVCETPEFDFGVGDADQLCYSFRENIPVEQGLCGNVEGWTWTPRDCLAQNRESCNNLAWLVSPWSACSSRCGDGATATREVTCYDFFQSSIVSDANCRTISTKPATSRACNQGLPCSFYTWKVSPWEVCPETCNTGSNVTSARNVTCIHVATSTGVVTEVNEVYCKAIEPRPGQVMQCSCENTEVITSSTLELSTTSSACVRDIGGTCCMSGKLNACGACDEDGDFVVDGIGVCCTSGVLDASLVCCESGELDACGVCDGTGYSCSQRLLYPAPDQLTSSTLSTAYEVAADNLSLSLGIRRNQIQLDVTATQERLNASSTSRRALANVESIWIVYPNQDDESWLRSLRLSGKDNNISLLDRVGYCGNGVCEIGEICSSTSALMSSSSCCQEDCPLLFPACPAGSSTKEMCNSRGKCLSSAPSNCVCFEGYAGETCEECAVNWVPGVLSDGSSGCIPTYELSTIVPTVGSTSNTPSQNPTTSPGINSTGVPTQISSYAPTMVPTFSNGGNIQIEEGEEPSLSVNVKDWLKKWWKLLVAGVIVVLALIVCLVALLCRGSVRCCWNTPKSNSKVVVANSPWKTTNEGPTLQDVSPVLSTKGDDTEGEESVGSRDSDSEASTDEDMHGDRKMALRTVVPPGVHHEGWLRMRTQNQGDVESWSKLYFVLYKDRKHFTYYSGMSKTHSYNVYTGELGSFSLSHLQTVRSSNKRRYRGRVFVLSFLSPHGKGELTTHHFMTESDKLRKEWVSKLSFYVETPSTSLSALDVLECNRDLSLPVGQRSFIRKKPHQVLVDNSGAPMALFLPPPAPPG